MKITQKRLEEIIGNRFIKVSGQVQHINELGLTKIQVKELARNILTELNKENK